MFRAPSWSAMLRFLIPPLKRHKDPLWWRLHKDRCLLISLDSLFSRWRRHQFIKYLDSQAASYDQIIHNLQKAECITKGRQTYHGRQRKNAYRMLYDIVSIQDDSFWKANFFTRDFEVFVQLDNMRIEWLRQK